jgi:hypothetical protein
MNLSIKKLTLFSLLAASVSLVGCTTRFVDYTLLSTKNVDLSKAETFKRGPNRITGEDSQTIIIFIPTSAAPNLKTAIDKAIESVPGAVALVDGVVSVRGWWFIVGENAIIAEGTPLIDPSIPGASAFLKADRIVSFHDPASNQQVARAVDQATFKQIKDLANQHEDAALSKLLLGLR